MVRRGAVLLVLLALGSGLAPQANAAGPACSEAGARAAIAASKPRLALLGPDKVLITPSQADKVLCFDLTGDGRADMAVSLFSGGTAGDVGWLFFVPDGARCRLARSGSGRGGVGRRRPPPLPLRQLPLRLGSISPRSSA